MNTSLGWGTQPRSVVSHLWACTPFRGLQPGYHCPVQLHRGGRERPTVALFACPGSIVQTNADSPVPALRQVPSTGPGSEHKSDLDSSIHMFCPHVELEEC